MITRFPWGTFSLRVGRRLCVRSQDCGTSSRCQLLRVYGNATYAHKPRSVSRAGSSHYHNELFPCLFRFRLPGLTLSETLRRRLGPLPAALAASAAPWISSAADLQRRPLREARPEGIDSRSAVRTAPILLRFATAWAQPCGSCRESRLPAQLRIHEQKLIPAQGQF